MRKVVVCGAAVAAILGVRSWCGGGGAHDSPLRFATFNIENFPKDSRQIDGAFAEIAQLEVSLIGVQEISDPGLFLTVARRRLGRRWDFVHVDTAPLGEIDAAHVTHHIGVLYDRDVYRVIAVASHDDTRLDGGRHKPTLEVGLRPRAGGADLRVFVVHLKSGGDGRDLRARQLAALVGLMRRARAARPADRVVLLGDFNATGDGDRVDIAAIAGGADMVWASEGLACSAFWDQEDDGCPRSRLDHVLTWAPATSVRAAGACATEGCDWQDSCPIYADHVSDHCPVVVTFDRHD